MSDIAFIDLKAQRKRIGKAMDAAILRVVNHGKYIMGPEVHELEQKLSDFCGATHSISCSNGTDALIMPLMAWGIGPGDAVFVPSFTFAATAEVVALIGATPVFVDVQKDSFNMCPESLKAAIQWTKGEGLKAKVIIPVGLFGQPADFDTIIPIARENNLKLLDDAAQSFGATYKGKSIGNIGDATATSFFPAKPLGCYGDGGAVFTNDDEAAEIIKSIRVHGKGGHKYDNARIGLNARLDTMQAAVLLEKLKIYPDELLKRQEVADRYRDALHNIVKTPDLPEGVTSAWAQYTVIINDDRDAIMAKLKEAGVPSVVYYPLPLHMQTAYKKFPTPDGCKNSKWLSEHVMSLPMHPYLTGVVQGKITKAILQGI